MGVAGCKKHTNEQQLPGVCSSCLRERLSKLSDSSSSFSQTANYMVSNSYNTSLSYASANSSTCISPTHRRHHRNSSDVMGSVSFILNANVGHGLKKSRSIAFVARSRSRDGSAAKNKGGRFFSKLIRTTSNRMKGVFMHSRTVKERFEY